MPVKACLPLLWLHFWGHCCAVKVCKQVCPAQGTIMRVLAATPPARLLSAATRSLAAPNSGLLASGCRPCHWPCAVQSRQLDCAGSAWNGAAYLHLQARTAVTGTSAGGPSRARVSEEDRLRSQQQARASFSRAASALTRPPQPGVREEAGPSPRQSAPVEVASSQGPSQGNLATAGRQQARRPSDEAYAEGEQHAPWLAEEARLRSLRQQQQTRAAAHQQGSPSTSTLPPSARSSGSSRRSNDPGICQDRQRPDERPPRGSGSSRRSDPGSSDRRRSDENPSRSAAAARSFHSDSLGHWARQHPGPAVSASTRRLQQRALESTSTGTTDDSQQTEAPSSGTPPDARRPPVRSLFSRLTRRGSRTKMAPIKANEATLAAFRDVSLSPAAVAGCFPSGALPLRVYCQPSLLLLGLVCC